MRGLGKKKWYLLSGSEGGRSTAPDSSTVRVTQQIYGAEMCLKNMD